MMVASPTKHRRRAAMLGEPTSLLMARCTNSRRSDAGTAVSTTRHSWSSAPALSYLIFIEQVTHRRR
jgi:hypothetical protein